MLFGLFGDEIDLFWQREETAFNRNGGAIWSLHLPFTGTKGPSKG